METQCRAVPRDKAEPIIDNIIGKRARVGT